MCSVLSCYGLKFQVQQNKHWVQKTVTELNFMKNKESVQKKVQKHYQ